ARMPTAMLGEQRLDMRHVRMPERQHGSTREPRAGPETGMRQLIDQHQVVAADQGGNDAGGREIAGAEHAGRFGALEAGETPLELGEQRVVAGYESGRAAADAMALGGLDRCRFDSRVMRQGEVVVAAEREEAPAVAFDPDAVEAVG